MGVKNKNYETSGKNAGRAEEISDGGKFQRKRRERTIIIVHEEKWQSQVCRCREQSFKIHKTNMIQLKEVENSTILF